uniref:Beta-galactoside alpha-2,6-sialyltransferase 2 n=1 Tax=Cyprinus carpio TaxID=7962 RepID=A0A8C2FYI4_CYPCA
MGVQDSLLPGLRHVTKQLAQLLLLFLLLWMLFFFVVFTYFTDSQVNQPHKIIPFNSESQHSSYVQHSSRAIMASHNSRWRLYADRKGPFQRRQVFQPPRARDEFYFRNLGEHRPRARKYLRKPPRSDYSDDYFSNDWSVVRGLWKGQVSSKMLSHRLQGALRDYVHSNKHNVLYKGQRKANKSREEMLCQMKQQAQLRTLDGSEQPFAHLGFKQLASSKLQKMYTTCAVVTSAGAILNSSLGREIVFTVHRIMRVLSSESGLYIQPNIFLFSQCPQWSQQPDYDLFTPYINHRKNFPEQPFYILHPSFIWKLWDIVQSNTKENIQPNPPSSGFIGIVMMMNFCEEVHVYEYIPSMRQSNLCHYHEKYYDVACTFGAYHPLLYEKLLIKRMSTASEEDLKKKGKVTLPGFSKINCPL